MNLEQIDTSTTAGKARVMQLAAEGRRVVYLNAWTGSWVECRADPVTWNWESMEYAIIAEPVGSDELWVVLHEEGDHSLMNNRDHAEQWASTHKDDKLVRYIRADLAREVKS